MSKQVLDVLLLRPRPQGAGARRPHLIKCFTAANNYLEENGKPYYYSDTNMICGYELQS